MNDFISKTGVGIGYADPPPVEPARTEWGVRHIGGKILGPYDSEGAALRVLTQDRNALKDMGIPEEYWPTMLQRDVETVVSSWRPLCD